MFVTTLALTGVLVTYSGGNEIGREKFTDDGKTLRSEITLAGKQATITLTRSPRTAVVETAGKTLKSDVPPGALALANGHWAAYALAVEQYPSAQGPVDIKVFLPGAGLTVDGKLRVSVEADRSRRVEITVGGLIVEAMVSASGAVTHVAVPQQGIEVRPEGAASPPAVKRALPADIVEEPVEIHDGAVKIRGVLWRPVKPAGKPPLALIIAGSGPTDRDGNSHIGLATDCYRLLAESLAAAGVASIRYDKRSIGASDVVNEADLSIDNYVADAVAWVAHARADQRFSKVTVIGHSEGGLVALLTANKTALDGLVLLSTAGRPLWQVLHEQLARQFQGDKLAELDLILAALRDGKAVKSYPPELAALFRPSVERFLRSELATDPVTLLAKLTEPVTIVQGETDVQVSVEDARRLATARKDKALRLVLLPHINHVLKDEAERALPQSCYHDAKRPLGAGVADAVVKGVVR